MKSLFSRPTAASALVPLALLSLTVGSILFAAPSGQAATRFCSLKDEIQSRTGAEMWGPASVQHHIRTLLHLPHVVDSTVASYPISYLVMTAERDKERCGGMLAADDPEHELIGDLLADVMSRWLGLATDTCLRSRPPVQDSLGICGAVQRSFARGDDTLRSAFELTSVYLSSHMASALSAVILSDNMWHEAFPPDTHCPQDGFCPSSVIKSRLEHVRAYKTLYDKNNAFLARHVGTVVRALADACYVKPGIATWGASGIDGLPINSLVFGQLRDQTFKAALTMAATMKREEHPMLRQTQNGEWHINYETVRAFTRPPAVLIDLESGARALFSSDALGWALKPLGARTVSDLRRLRPSINAACEYPAPAL